MERADSNYISDVCIVITPSPCKTGNHVPTTVEQSPTSPISLSKPRFQQSKSGNERMRENVKTKERERDIEDPIGEVMPSPVPLFWASQLSCCGIAVC